MGSEIFLWEILAIALGALLMWSGWRRLGAKKWLKQALGALVFPIGFGCLTIGGALLYMPFAPPTP